MIAALGYRPRALPCSTRQETGDVAVGTSPQARLVNKLLPSIGCGAGSSLPNLFAMRFLAALLPSEASVVKKASEVRQMVSGFGRATLAA